MKIVLLIGGLLTALSTPALASAWECKFMIERAVTDDFGKTWQRGKILPVDIQREDAKGISFCAHGGPCIPQMTGNGVAGHLIDCRKGQALGGGDFALVHFRQ